jgi:hypothetical protein
VTGGISLIAKAEGLCCESDDFYQRTPMQNNRFPHARRIWQYALAVIALALLSGCEEVRITNLTPSTLPENPSQTYTFSARITPRASGFVKGSLSPRIVIDGQIHPLQPSQLGQDIWEFDYQIPAGRSEVAYYYLVNFRVNYNGEVASREAYTGVQHAKLAGRYVLSLEVNRGPVGARVSVLGRGFTAQDVVYFDNTPARTVFDSPNSLSFFVPAVEPGRNYRIQVSGPNGSQAVGTFRVDSVTLTVMPSSLNLRRGETQSLTFTLPNPAPAGGLLLDATTDVPESIIMPEIVVPAGSNTVTVQVTGGQPGSGSLFLQGFGAGEISVPVSVR